MTWKPSITGSEINAMGRNKTLLHIIVALMVGAAAIGLWLLPVN